MGFVRKITGQQAQIDAARENAARQEASAKQAADAAARQAQGAAKASADAAAQASARSAAEEKAAEVVSAPLGQADVSVDAQQTETTTAATRRKRTQFGRTYNTGVGL